MKYPAELGVINTLALGVERKKSSLQQIILSWASDHPLRYPWREPGTPAYRVLIGEILLHKLKAAAAAAYERFLQTVPLVSDLLAADDEAMAELLEAVNLKDCQECFRKLRYGLALQGSGDLPRDTDTMGRISGLPRHHVKAVFCFGYGLPIAVVDPNVARMLANIFAASLPPEPSGGLVESVAEGLVSYYEPQRYNGVMLDLAELVCQPGLPRCPACPLNSLCDAVPGIPSAPRSLVRTV